MNRVIGTLRLFLAATGEGRQARSPLAVHEREAVGPCRAASSLPPRRLLPAAPARHAPGPPAAKVGLRLRPGQKGTSQLLALYGDRLVCVRYRYDPERKKRLKTAEILVAERDWEPPPARFAPAEIVGVRVALDEMAIRDREAGGWEVERGTKSLATALRLRGQARSRQAHRRWPGIQYWMPGGERRASTGRCLALLSNRS
jgi:hypothetical protein